VQRRGLGGGRAAASAESNGVSRLQPTQLRGGEEPAAATPGLGQTQSGVDPGRKFVASDPSPEYDGLEDSKPWSRKASIWE
jgi:hypothetical protein